MSIDVFSQSQCGSRGTLIGEDGGNLLYANNAMISHTGQLIGLQKGMSYEVITGDDNLTVDFESQLGAGDGVSLKILLDMLIHHAETNFDIQDNDNFNVAIQSLKMAKTALK